METYIIPILICSGRQTDRFGLQEQILWNNEVEDTEIRDWRTCYEL